MYYFPKPAKLPLHTVIYYMHTPNKPNPRKTNRTQNAPNTAHCRQSVKQTYQRTKKVVEHTVPNKNGSEALKAMRSTRWETKDTREVERATRDTTETGQARSQASSARRNGNGTDEKSSEQGATQWKRDKREVKRAVRDGAETGRTGSRAKNAQRNETGRWGKNGREMRSERTVLSNHSKNSTKQPSRNSRTNLSHTLGRWREATARQSSIVHYGA